MMDRFAKAVIEYAGRGRYIYSCDSCAKIATEVTPIFTGRHGEKIDLCSECLASGFKSMRGREV